MSGCYSIYRYALLAAIIHLLKLVIMEIFDVKHFSDMEDNFVKSIYYHYTSWAVKQRTQFDEFLQCYGLLKRYYIDQEMLKDKGFITYLFNSRTKFVTYVFFSDVKFTDSVLYSCEQFINAFDNLTICYSGLLKGAQVMS